MIQIGEKERTGNELNREGRPETLNRVGRPETENRMERPEQTKVSWRLRKQDGEGGQNKTKVKVWWETNKPRGKGPGGNVKKNKDRNEV